MSSAIQLLRLMTTTTMTRAVMMDLDVKRTTSQKLQSPGRNIHNNSTGIMLMTIWNIFGRTSSWMSQTILRGIPWWQGTVSSLILLRLHLANRVVRLFNDALQIDMLNYMGGTNATKHPLPSAQIPPWQDALQRSTCWR